MSEKQKKYKMGRGTANFLIRGLFAISNFGATLKAAILGNKVSCLILLTQAYLIYRVEGLHNKLDALIQGIPAALLALYVNLFFMLNEIGSMIQRLVEVFKA